MKKITSIIILILLSLSIISAQEDFSVEKVDDTEFPYIKVYVRAKKTLHIKDFVFSENDTKLKYVCDTIEGDEYGIDANSILFVINEQPETEIKDALIKSIKQFSKQDKLNLAVILDEDTSQNIIHYLSPEFSNNHNFFINVLNQNTTSNIAYEINSKNKKDAKLIEQKIFQNQDIYSNKAIVFLVGELKNKPEQFSSLLNKTNIPIYILQTEKADSINQKILSEICTKSKGIYTISDINKVEKHLKSYLEDISLNKNSSKPEMLRFIFETKQSQKKNFFKIEYQKEIKQYIFNRPQKHLLSYREQLLFFLSGILLILLLFVIFRKKKKNKAVLLKSVQNTSPVSVLPVKTIEINVKTKGFNKTYFFEKHIIRIGRNEDNDIVIPDRTVSTFHALINREGDKFLLQDLGSTNGVFLNQKKIKKHNLKTNDKIKLGAAILIVRV